MGAAGLGAPAISCLEEEAQMSFSARAAPALLQVIQPSFVLPRGQILFSPQLKGGWGSAPFLMKLIQLWSGWQKTQRAAHFRWTLRPISLRL